MQENFANSKALKKTGHIFIDLLAGYRLGLQRPDAGIPSFFLSYTGLENATVDHASEQSSWIFQY